MLSGVPVATQPADLVGELDPQFTQRVTELLERIEQRGRVDLPPAADILAEQRAGR